MRSRRNGSLLRSFRVAVLSLLVYNGHAWISNRLRSAWRQHYAHDDSVFENEAVLEAAAAFTQQTSPLLGVRSLGLDFGTRRTGVAVTSGYAPTPLTTIADHNLERVLSKILGYCTSQQVSRVVLGMPLHSNGTQAIQTRVTRAFSERLAAAVLSTFGPDVPVHLWDERYTSKAAKAKIYTANPKHFDYQSVDVDSACMILEHYYSEGGKDAERVQLDQNTTEACLATYEKRQAKLAQVNKAGVEYNQPGSWEKRQQEATELARLVDEELKASGKWGKSRKTRKKKKKKKQQSR